jgi:hypothetical protein
VQRQDLFDGEPSEAHGQMAEISVYVFAHDGAAWAFEAGSKHVTKTGSYGRAPPARLIRLGEDETGLLFEGGFMNQGEINSYAFVVTLSDGAPRVAGTFQLGDEKTCDEESGEKQFCWGWEGKLELVRRDGQDHDLVRVARTGTEWDFDVDKAVDHGGTECFAFDAAKFEKVEDPRCAKYPARPERKVFGAEEGKEAK